MYKVFNKEVLITYSDMLHEKVVRLIESDTAEDVGGILAAALNDLNTIAQHKYLDLVNKKACLKLSLKTTGEVKESSEGVIVSVSNDTYSEIIFAKDIIKQDVEGFGKYFKKIQNKSVTINCCCYEKDGKLYYYKNNKN